MNLVRHVVYTRVADIVERFESVNWRKTGKRTRGADGQERDEYVCDQQSRGWFVRFVGSWESLNAGAEKPAGKIGDPVKVTYLIFPWQFPKLIEEPEYPSYINGAPHNMTMKNLRQCTFATNDGKPFEPAKVTEALKAAGFLFNSEECPVKIKPPWDTINADDGSSVTFRQWDV